MTEFHQGSLDDMSLQDFPCEDPVRFSAERLLALVDRIKKGTVCQDCEVAILRDIAADLNSIA